jgi:hypothetical protein
MTWLHFRSIYSIIRCLNEVPRNAGTQLKQLEFFSAWQHVIVVVEVLRVFDQESVNVGFAVQYICLVSLLDFMVKGDDVGIE